MSIKSGDRLILKDRGREREVVAVGDEQDGTVQVKENGNTLTVSVYIVGLAKRQATNRRTDRHLRAAVKEKGRLYRPSSFQTLTLRVMHPQPTGGNDDGRRGRPAG